MKKFAKDKHYGKFKDHCYPTGKYGVAANSISNLRFSVPNEFPVVFYNGSKKDYHFITKKLANNFKEKFECLEDNAEKYKTFSIWIEKEIIKVNKDGNEDILTISHKIKFIDSARFKAISVSVQS